MLGELLVKFRKYNLEASLYLYGASLFFGNAAMSISFVCLILCSLPFIIRNFDIRRFASHRISLAMFFYFVINILITIILSPNYDGLIKINRLLPFLILPIIFVSVKKLFKDKRFYSNLTKVIFFASSANLVISLFYGLYRAFLNKNIIYLTYNHFSDLFGVQPIYLSVFFLLGILFAINIMERQDELKNIYKTGAFFLFLGIILLGSRTSMIISVIILLIRLYGFVKSKRNYFILIGSMVLMGAILIASFPTLKNRVLKYDENISSYSGSELRFKIWRSVVEVASEAPIFGYGLVNSQEILMNQYVKVNFRRAYINKLNAHNQYLQTFLDSGIIGFLFLMFMLLSIANFNRDNAMINLFLIVVVISLFTESFFRRQEGVLFFCFFTLFLYFQGICITKGKGNI